MEVRALITSLRESDPWRPLILTAVFVGLRASELRGLRWSDVDLTKAELHVRQRADRYLKIGEPKSEAGYRTLPLVPTLAAALKRWKLACPKGSLDLVFPFPTGCRCDAAEWYIGLRRSSCRLVAKRFARAQ